MTSSITEVITPLLISRRSDIFELITIFIYLTLVLGSGDPLKSFILCNIIGSYRAISKALK